MNTSTSQTNNLKASKLLSKEVETKLLAICKVTGIAITIEAPAIKGFALEYTNPLSLQENFLKIASLPSSTLAEFPQNILAGILLAVYKHHSLLNCPLSAAAQNLSLQSVHPTVLIDSLNYFASLSERKAARLPCFYSQA